MKILYHHRIASKDGQYVHIEELTSSLRNMGHEIIFVGPKIVENDGFGSKGGVVHYLKRFMPKVIYELFEFTYSFMAYYKLKQAVSQYKPDFIYERYNLYMPAGIWIKKRFNLKILLEVNAPIYDERNKYDGIAIHSLARWTERYVWKNADIILPVTKVLSDRILKENISNEKIHIIPNGIDRKKFSQIPDTDSAKKKLNMDGVLVLGFTGFMRDWHGLDKVVELLTINDSIKKHLLFVGDGPARKSIEDKAKKLGVSDMLTITGIVERENIIDYVSAFDVALQPDVVSYASPLKLFEYMALGRAIIAPDTENICEVLTDKSDALLFNNKDKDDFLVKINELCMDDELRSRLGKEARSTIENRKYYWESNARRVTELASELIN